jgi:ATP-dependent exoDNAse (exonuclease V) beta subunit
LLYEAGDPNWFLHLPQMAAAPAIPAAAQATTKLPAIRLARPLPCRERGLPRRTPSQHDRAGSVVGVATDGVETASSAAAAVPEAISGSVAAPAPRTGRGRRPAASAKASSQPIDPRLRGIVFHAGFEALEWLADGETPDAATLYTRLRRQVQDQSLTADLLRRLVDEFLQSLRLSAIRHVFSRDALGGSAVLAGWCEAVRSGRAQVVVDRERSFVRIHDGALIQGTIDRLVLVRENGRVVAADVVDFKTDRLSGDADLWRKEKAAHYAGQLEEYRKAVRHITSAPQLPVSTRLLLMEDASVVEVPGR